MGAVALPKGYINFADRRWRAPDRALTEEVRSRRLLPYFLRKYSPTFSWPLQKVLDFFPKVRVRIIHGIWYGPSGEEGECATEVEELDWRRWRVTEYQDSTGYFDEPIDPSILVRSCEVESLDAQCAAGKGVDFLAYWGGEEQDETDELPAI